MLQRIWLMSQEVFWCALFSSFTISLFLSFYRILLLIAIRNTIDNTYVSTIYPYDSIIQSAHEYVIFIRRDEMDWNGLSRAEILEWDWNRFSSHIVLFLYVYVNRRKKNRYWIHVEIMCIILLYIFFFIFFIFFYCTPFESFIGCHSSQYFAKTILLSFYLFRYTYLLNFHIDSLYDNSLCFHNDELSIACKLATISWLKHWLNENVLRLFSYYVLFMFIVMTPKAIPSVLTRMISLLTYSMYTIVCAIFIFPERLYSIILWILTHGL